MKRTALDRRTPLTRRTALNRATQLAPMSAERRRTNRVRRQAELALFDLAPYCARCGRTNTPLAGHETVNRARGGDPTKPDVLLCNPCNEWAESHPRDAERSGWKRRSPSLRHWFAPDELGFYCATCALPAINRNRHYRPGETP